MNGLQTFMPEALSIEGVCSSDSLFFFFIKFCSHRKAKQLLTLKPPCHGIAEQEKAELNVSLDTVTCLHGQFHFAVRSCTVAILMLSGHNPGSSGQFFEVSHTFSSTETEQSFCTHEVTEVQGNLNN